jgi:multidrug efflux pump subunit AcrB
MIAFFARNGVAANLLMGGIILWGLTTLRSGKIPIEVFPEFESNIISISVPYRGGTPEEVEESVVIRVEEAIADIEGIDRIISTASTSSASITVEVDNEHDRVLLMDEVKAAVDSITGLPDEAERPLLSFGKRYFSVINVVVFGNLNERDFRTLGEQIRDEIIDLPSVTSAELQAVRPHELAIEIDEATLQRYGLNFDSITRAVRMASVDLTAGTLKTPSGNIVLRTKGRAYRKADFEAITVLTNPDGSRLTLADVATVKDGFDENPFWARFNGQRGVLIAVSREGNQSAIKLAEEVKAYLDERRATLPAGVGIDYWSDRSRIVKARLDILFDSALKSILLVFLLLTLFLRPSLAFWTVLGIPVCFLGAIALMPTLGVTINIVSLFGFILVLGVVVDDAIVTGENIYTHQRRGTDPLEAAITGTREVTVPVVFGVLTTVVAFTPLLAASEGMTRFFSHIALIVIPVLLFSLVESKLILPAHLSHSLRAQARTILQFFLPRVVVHNLRHLYGYFERFQQGIATGLERFITAVYQPLLNRALRMRYLTLSLFVGIFILLLGMLLGDRIKQVHMPRVQSERAACKLRMQEGTPFAVTESHIEKIQAAAEQLRDELEAEGGTQIIKDIMSVAGGSSIGSSRRRGAAGQDEAGEVVFYVVEPENRALAITTTEIVNRWRKKIGPIRGARELNFRAEIRHGGDPIDIQLTGPDIARLNQATREVRDHLSSYEGIFDVGDSLDSGRDEIQLTIRPEAEQFGLTMMDLGRQVRQAFYGEEIQRILRGRDEIRVMLRYPEHKRRSIDALETMFIRTPAGDELPFSSVAETRMEISLPEIRRIDRKRAINITADADKENLNLDTIRAELGRYLDGEFRQRFPGVSWSMEGQAREQRETEASQRTSMYLVLFAIFALLAIPFRSYVQPLIVMSVIPFGLVGAVGGHLWRDFLNPDPGMPISMLSYFGMLALAGVVVNDSLVLVDYINRKTREGMSLLEAASTAGARRFRPILLTSLTTFAGLIPLIQLKSTNAQFLIPMAVSLGYGILFATLITLFLVPAQFLILEDIKALMRGKREASD